jgi:hypothetical protein
MAGKNVFDASMKKWKIKTKTKALTKTSFGKFVNYGSANMASTYAFDKENKFTKTPFGLHAMSFFIGGFSGSLNSTVLSDKAFYGEGTLVNFAKRLTLSSTVLHFEYVMQKTIYKGKVDWKEYRKKKRFPLGFKATWYSIMNGL